MGLRETVGVDVGVRVAGDRVSEGVGDGVLVPDAVAAESVRQTVAVALAEQDRLSVREGVTEGVPERERVRCVDGDGSVKVSVADAGLAVWDRVGDDGCVTVVGLKEAEIVGVRVACALPERLADAVRLPLRLAEAVRLTTDVEVRLTVWPRVRVCECSAVTKIESEAVAVLVQEGEGEGVVGPEGVKVQEGRAVVENVVLWVRVGATEGVAVGDAVAEAAQDGVRVHVALVVGLGVGLGDADAVAEPQGLCVAVQVTVVEPVVEGVGLCDGDHERDG